MIHPGLMMAVFVTFAAPIDQEWIKVSPDRTGKPVVIEETFPLKCSSGEFSRFLSESRSTASGWIGFYWGKSLDELRISKSIPDVLMASWLDIFR